jgi:hydroxymethylglutaryl-CoA lyase
MAIDTLANQLPEKIVMLELLLRDGLQHSHKLIPTETKVWFADRMVKAGYRNIEVTNFAHPKLLPQCRDAEEVMKQVSALDSVKQNNVHLKCYGMTLKAFERAAQCAQSGYGPHYMAFTISAEDFHGRRNSGRTREEYLKEIPEFVRIAKENGFEVDMAIACAYGSPCTGPVPIENTFELIDRGLDMGIRYFSPCDTSGESNPRRSYEYMAALVDRYGKYDGQLKYRIAHFHEARGMSIANTVAAIQAGARVVEASLGSGGGQPAFIVNGVPGIGTGPLYTNSYEVGNCSTEDILVALDEMGIETLVDIDKVLELGRMFEWVMEKTLPVWTTKAGRPIHHPVEWNLSADDLSYLPPYGPSQIFWAAPGKYKPATMSQVQSEFKGRELRVEPYEQQLKGAESAWPTRLVGGKGNGHGTEPPKKSASGRRTAPTTKPGTPRAPRVASRKPRPLPRREPGRAGDE